MILYTAVKCEERGAELQMKEKQSFIAFFSFPQSKITPTKHKGKEMQQLATGSEGRRLLSEVASHAH